MSDQSKNNGKMKPSKGSGKQGNILRGNEYEIRNGKLVLKEEYYNRREGGSSK